MQDQYLSPHMLRGQPAAHPKGNHSHFKLRPETIQDKLASRQHLRTNSYDLKASHILDSGPGKGPDEGRTSSDPSSSKPSGMSLSQR